MILMFFIQIALYFQVKRFKICVDVQLILRKDIRILDFLSGSFSFVVEVYSGYTIDNVVGCNLLYDIDNITEIKKRVKTLNIWLKCI